MFSLITGESSFAICNAAVQFGILPHNGTVANLTRAQLVHVCKTARCKRDALEVRHAQAGYTNAALTKRVVLRLKYDSSSSDNTQLTVSAASRTQKHHRGFSIKNDFDRMTRFELEDTFYDELQLINTLEISTFRLLRAGNRKLDKILAAVDCRTWRCADRMVSF